MPCDEKRHLDSVVDSNAHHLEARLKEKETDDLTYELIDIRRMAKDLTDSINVLRKHEDQHGCNK